MGKDPEEQILKAERLFKAHQYKKSGKTYHAAGMAFIQKEYYNQAKY
jgi:hypothetical protein